jgi:D-beta-D-heptose 7-phosphate kinase/D-beta-D-heptose 1-phosphate adenosyltransferase
MTDRPRVFVVGDVMLDRYVYGVVERISPEAPVLVLREESVTETLGGAGNVLANVISLGGEGLFVSVVGSDGAGERVREFVLESSSYSSMVVASSQRTTVKERHVSAGQQLFRVDREDIQPIGSFRLTALCEEVEEFVRRGCQTVILADYGKGVLSADGAAEVIKAVGRGNRDTFIIVDPSGDDPMRYVGCSLIKPNRRELRLLTGGMPVESLAEIFYACLKLMRATGAWVLVTLGADGMYLVTGDYLTPDERHFHAVEADVVDVTGAGDTVAAALAVGLAGGQTIDYAVDLALRAAAKAVSSRGTVAVPLTPDLPRLHLSASVRDAA